MTLKFTILGCGSSGGVPRPALGWGVCDPNNPKNRRRRTSFLVERRTPDGVTRVLVDTSPDLREQLLDANVDWVDAVLFTHEHADHTHGIDDLRGLFINRRKRVPVWLDERVSQIMHARFGYCFASRARQRISAHGAREPHGALPHDHRRGAGRRDHRPAHPPGAWRHHLARLPLRLLGLFLRPERPAAGQRDGARRPRRLDHRRAARQAASEPSQRRAGAGLDREPQAASARSSPTSIPTSTTTNCAAGCRPMSSRPTTG